MLTAKEAEEYIEIRGDNHCAFHCIAECLAQEGIAKPGGRDWTWKELRRLVKPLTLEQIKPSLPTGATVDLDQARPTLIVNESRTAWEVLSRQLWNEASKTEMETMLAVIEATDIYSERPDRIEVNLSSNISAVMTAYASAISGEVSGLETLWAGDLEFTLLVRRFKLRIAVYFETSEALKHPPPTDPTESRFLPEHWALLKEYTANDAKGRLHKLMYKDRNHYNYVTDDV